MFGSDEMGWPDAIGLAIITVEQAPFLTAGRKPTFSIKRRSVFQDEIGRAEIGCQQYC
jgi:hypothetical protein